MFKSKALKPRKFRFQYEDEDKNVMENVVFYFKKFFIWPITDNYRRTKERLSRSLAYARFGWLNYDFDMACAWHLFEFKLKRLRKCFKNGHSVQEPEEVAALNELIKIVKRLGLGSYENKYYRQHERKWGKLESRTEPWIRDGKEMGSQWFSWRTKCPEDAPQELKDQERADTRTIYENAEKDRVKDLEKMCKILIEFGQSFWD